MPATNPQEVDITSYAGVAPVFASSDPAAANVPLFAMGVYDGTFIERIQTPGANGDGATSFHLASFVQFAFNGSTYDRIRTPNIFKTVTATALGDTAVWTPAAGKKFRLMAFFIEVTENATTAGGVVEEIVLRDATTPIGVGFSDFVPAAAVSGNAPATSGWIVLGNGYLSSAANNVLNVNLGTALSAGESRVVAIGTEE